MVPKARIELARPWATAPSRQRVYQFHHFGTQLCVLYTTLWLLEPLEQVLLLPEPLWALELLLDQ